MTTPDDLQTFHAGERQLQARVGVRERMAALGNQVIRTSMPDQHRAFFAQLPFVVVGGLDAEAQPWASILARPPGFISSPDAQHLRICAHPDDTDPLHDTLVVGASIALLGIEPDTRRRNRMNGAIEQIDVDSLLVGVQQSFGNCPKYIQTRRAVYEESTARPTLECLDMLDESALKMITRADTLFIATAHPDASANASRSHGVDVSHRGGKPGFVHIDGSHQLTLPDFAGNRFFNTLGNLQLNPRAGLLFIDFETSDLLYIAADAEIIFAGPEVTAFPGAERLVRFHIRQLRYVSSALPLRWQGEVQLSPFLESMDR